MGGIDRHRVMASFHRHAGNYDSHAQVQKRVVARLLEQSLWGGIQPKRLLDIGSGTGRMLAALQDLYPQSLKVGADLAFGMCRTARDNQSNCRRTNFLTADAEYLPFAGDAFDLVLSTSTYQWLAGLDQAFREVWRVLAPGGIFCFALFGERTLFELKDSYRLALGADLSGRENRTHNFFNSSDVATALDSAGFSNCLAHAELEVEHHQDVPALLRSLKRIGAGNAAPDTPRGLAGRRVMLEMMEVYCRRYGCAEGIPATYEVVYGVGRKGRK